MKSSNFNLIRKFSRTWIKKEEKRWVKFYIRFKKKNALAEGKGGRSKAIRKKCCSDIIMPYLHCLNKSGENSSFKLIYTIEIHNTMNKL